MTTAAAKIKAKRERRPIYAVIERVAVLETGEERLAILAAHPVDRRLMKERGYRAGDEVRIEVKKSRNAKFHRLAHAVGSLLVDNVEDFRGLNSHDALKRVQVEAGVCCEVVEMNASPVVSALLAACESVLGKGARKMLEAVLPEIRTIPVTVARSIAFDEMGEDEFAELFIGVTDYIDRTYQSAMTQDVRAEYLLMVGGNNG